MSRLLRVENENDVKEYMVLDDIPLPGAPNAGFVHKALLQLRVGESILFTGKGDAASARSATGKYTGKFSMRTLGSDTVRVWRKRV